MNIQLLHFCNLESFSACKVSTTCAIYSRRFLQPVIFTADISIWQTDSNKWFQKQRSCKKHIVSLRQEKHLLVKLPVPSNSKKMKGTRPTSGRCWCLKPNAPNAMVENKARNTCVPINRSWKSSATDRPTRSSATIWIKASSVPCCP